ncbi:MAG: hypothetical protein NWQ27_04275 [Crocinitomicaceae bacterium]|jgi:hypothetical protein|nr:hypothetical protein [Crocinitomicaceae bacterium]MDP5009939.1 hypothetical protein [Crocinitomicaceae bacterium]MDP5099188.1 hypothetical protein [Crocinitomicaceae bacterium]
MKLFTGLLLLLLISSCKVEKEVSTEKEVDKIINRQNTLKITAYKGSKDTENSENYTIKDIKIIENSMLIELHYLGGCGEHSFKMVGLSIPQASLQPVRQVQLIHTSINEECKEEKRVLLEVDIRELAAQKIAGTKTYLNIDQWNSKIEYVYSEKL